MTDIPGVRATDEAAGRDDAVSKACVDEYMHRPEVGPVEGAAPLGHPCVAQPEQWWPNPGEDPVASFGGVSVSYGALPILFTLGGILTMVFAFTGIGTWFGARYPNFEEAMKGNPDIVTMYIYSMLCLLLGAIIVGLPFAVLLFDPFLGMLSIIFAADVGLFILYGGIKMAGREFDRMEPSF